MQFRLILSNTGIVALFFIHIGCVILFFKRLRFWPYFCKHWNYYLIVANVGIVGLFYTHRILIFSFKILAFWSYFYKHRNSDLSFLNISNSNLIPQTLEFLTCPSSAMIGVVALSYPSNHWDCNLDLLFRNKGILALSLRTLKFLSDRSNVGILAVFLYTFVFSSYP